MAKKRSKQNEKSDIATKDGAVEKETTSSVRFIVYSLNISFCFSCSFSIIEKSILFILACQNILEFRKFVKLVSSNVIDSTAHSDF